MRSPLTPVLLLFMVTLPAGAADLTVHVIDPQEGIIPAATVILTPRDGERRILSSDANGSCRFNMLAPGPYFIQAQAPGFEPSPAQAIVLKSEGTMDISLHLGVANVRSSIVVTATGTPQSTDELSKALTVIDADTIRLQVDRSVGEALEKVPGLRVQQLGGPVATNYFKVRGLRNADTAVLVDGLRLRDAAGTQADASGVLQDLVITNASRIEVLRGAGSSLYGTDATGGVVNLITDDGGGRTRGSLALDGGSLGAVRGMARLAGGFHQDRVAYSMGITHWNVTNGVDRDSPARNTSGQGQVTFRLSRIAWFSARLYAGDSFGFVRLTPQSVGTLPSRGIIDAVPLPLAEEHRYEAGTPISRLALGGATFMPAAYNSDSTRAGRFFTGAIRFVVRPSEGIGLTAQYQHLSTRRDYGDGPAGPGFQPKGNNYSLYRGDIETADIRLNAGLGRFQRFDAGYEFENEDFQNRLLPPPPSTNFFTAVSQFSHSVFAQDQIRLLEGRFQIAGAYRAQFFSLNRPSFEPLTGAPFAGRTFTAPPSAQTGDLSIAYMLRATGTKIRAHAGRGYRAPSLYERFGTFYNGSAYTLYGDPELRPDRSSSIDGGIDQTFWNARAQMSATYFYTRLNEVIVFDTTGAFNSLTDPLGRNGGYRNTHGGLARGVEFSSALAATASLRLEATYTYTDARQQTPLAAGVWQTYEIPRHQYSAIATERVSSRWTTFVAYTGSTDYLASISGRAFRFGGRARVQGGVNYRRPLREFRALRLYFRGDNLSGQNYFENGFRTPRVGLTGGMEFEF